MSKRKQNNGPSGLRYGKWLIALVIVAALVLIAVNLPRGDQGRVDGTNSPPTTPVIPAKATAAPVTNLPSMSVNEAVMVTAELDFGPQIPTVAAALREIERRSQPDDGVGRAFAILDAYGEPTPQGKLHLSMHVSTEKTGGGALVFKRTGEVLWQSKIVTATNAAKFTGKNLLILVSDGAGRSLTVDGSNHPATILQANAKELGVSIESIWPEGAEREVTFLYSACGCPVKVMVRRTGDRTVRTKEMPVIFPDDPAVVVLISKLMAW